MSTVSSISEDTSALDVTQRSLVPISAHAAAGDMEALKRAIDAGLDAGLSINAAKEALVQLYAYAGFPRSLNALGVLKARVEARAEAGKEDVEGPDPTGSTLVGEALLERGTENQTRLAGREVSGALFDFVPVANTFLRSHLFGDIFERDNLDWQSREVATIAMLAGMTGAESQLKSHLNMGTNAGLSRAQLEAIVVVLRVRVSPEAARRAETALAEFSAS